MTSIAFAATGDATELFSIPEWIRRAGRANGPSTTVNLTLVPSSEAVDVLTSWNELYEGDAHPLHYPETEIEAVEFVRDQLRLSVTDVLAAVGVSEKSFYNWKNKGCKPHKASLGRLWPMTQAIHALASAHPNFYSWFHSNEGARKSFTEGDINGLALAELEWSTRTRPAAIRPIPDFDSVGTPTPHPSRKLRNGKVSNPQQGTTRRIVR